MSESVYVVEKSWEATTLDYLSPNWYVVESFVGADAALVEEAAEEAVAALWAAQSAAFEKNRYVEPIAYRVRKEYTKAEVDAFLEAEFAANAQYWADRALAAGRVLETERRYLALRGQRVVVTGGRKVAKGTTGEVFWVGEKQWGWRVGFKTDEGETVWVDARWVEVVAEREEVAV